MAVPAGGADAAGGTANQKTGNKYGSQISTAQQKIDQQIDQQIDGNPPSAGRQ
ncbi:Rv0909 family putative TA system antitoxin [Streptacidiphilus sp. P02-A3a]|uniref:Rv0909 family putative TA system antitoxin n=1 Tax=Streptacidiphilus sp. P02-A3a TaxID=2704468 RepID=UPI0015FBE099|nr:Rv0909 family putative TA system antitoxin [Streptacidiphilus sp. P02-A3a]QMU72055.1 hypothetical protein GXP74_31270 [Streptacidiphilus sp. P02-A3a]